MVTGRDVPDAVDGGGRGADSGVQGTDFTTGNSAAVGDDVAIPETFPAGYPKYPGAKTQVALRDSQMRSYTTNQQTGDGVLQVKAWAEQALTGQGYAKFSEIVDANNVILSFRNARGEHYQVQAARDEARSLTYVVVVFYEAAQ